MMWRNIPSLVLAGLLALASPSGRAETVISLEFDDANQDQYQVRQMLLDRGMRATFFVLSPRIGKSGYLTLAQLKELENDGNEIGGHTLDHVDLTKVSAAEAERQVCEDRAALINAGFHITDFAYPYGATNDDVKSIVAGCGYESARAIGGVGGCASCPSAESLPPASFYATRTRASIKSDVTLATLQGYVTAAENGGGGWVQLVIHYVCDGASCPGTSISPSTLTAFLDWLAARAERGTVTRTVREALHPTGPPPPPPPSDTVPPETAIACSPQGCSEWSSGPITVTLASTDDQSGVAEIRYTNDGSEPSREHGFSCGENPCTLVIPESATIRYRAWDLAGNAEATHSQTIQVDTRPPEVQLTSPGYSAVIAGTITVKASATDDSGVAEVGFYADGRLIARTTAAPYQAQWNSALSGSGTHRLHAKAKDLAGNTAVSTSVSVRVCAGDSGPYGDQDQNGIPDSCETPAERFIRGDCNGDGAAVGEVTDALYLLQFNFTGGERPPCLSACDVNGDGRVLGEISDAIYLLTFNFLGGQSPPAPFPTCGAGALETDADVGCTDPPVACSPPPPPPPPPPSDTVPPATVIACSPRGCTEWSTEPVTVTLTSTDAGSGVAGIRYTTDGSEPSSTHGLSCGENPCSFVLTESATVRYRAWDLAGNAEATRSQLIRVDTLSPEVQVTSPGDLSVVLGTITVKANATDDSGIAEVSFYADGKLIARTSTAPYQVRWNSTSSGIGTHRLHAEATDLAGNTTSSTAVRVVGGGL